jgi:hypothetical protein
MMTGGQFEQCLLRLGLSVDEAAQLLSVTPRTVRRWLEGEDVSGPAEQAVRAWIRLHDHHLPWRPDSASVLHDDQDQIARLRSHAIGHAELLARVAARGGPRLPWSVDWDSGRATLGPVEVAFHKLLNGNFSLSTYRRKDSAPDTDRDRELLEDAAYCISRELEKKSPLYGPVTLVLHDRSPKSGAARQTLKGFCTANDAIEWLSAAPDAPHFVEPFIMTEDQGELLWSTQELRRECERRVQAPAALAALAEYVQEHSAIFVRTGPHMLSPAETAERRSRIEALGRQLSELAGQSAKGTVRYLDFEPVLGALHAAGFFPETELVSAVARALVRP